MLKLIVALMTRTLTQSGCSVFGEHTDEIYRLHSLSDESRQKLEGLKREFLQHERRSPHVAQRWFFAAYPFTNELFMPSCMFAGFIFPDPSSLWTFPLNRQRV
jgi:hypothetical protein